MFTSGVREMFRQESPRLPLLQIQERIRGGGNGFPYQAEPCGGGPNQDGGLGERWLKSETRIDNMGKNSWTFRIDIFNILFLNLNRGAQFSILQERSMNPTAMEKDKKMKKLNKGLLSVPIVWMYLGSNWIVAGLMFIVSTACLHWYLLL